MSGRTGILVQIRMGSTRLPGKALLPLQGFSVARHAMRALAAVGADVHALVTDAASEAALAPEAAAERWELFVGPEQDVLRRYALAAAHFGLTRVVRATGDAPLVSARLAREIIAHHAAREADLSHYLHCPLGTGVEVIEGEALREADLRAAAVDEREHITTYLYRNRPRFVVEEPACPPECGLSGVYVTVDTQADYEKITRIFAALYDGSPIETDRLVAWLKDHPE